MKRPSVLDLVRSHWQDDEKEVSRLTNELQKIIDKLNDDEVRTIESVIDMALEKGRSDEAEMHVGEDI